MRGPCLVSLVRRRHRSGHHLPSPSAKKRGTKQRNPCNSGRRAHQTCPSDAQGTLFNRRPGRNNARVTPFFSTVRGKKRARRSGARVGGELAPTPDGDGQRPSRGRLATLATSPCRPRYAKNTIFGPSLTGGARRKNVLRRPPSLVGTGVPTTPEDGRRGPFVAAFENRKCWFPLRLFC